jgi:hypothetical protein
MCHGTERWSPATFAHDEHFRLDRDHDVECTTCHTTPDYRQYTCYGCHEHTPDDIRGRHAEEGITKLDDCVECHRSTDEHDLRRPRDGSEGGREDRRRKRDDH